MAQLASALRNGGVFPIKADMSLLEAAELEGIVEYVHRHRDAEGPFEVVTYADLRGDADHVRDQVAGWTEAGASWLHVGPGEFEPPESFRRRVRNGPPGSGSADADLKSV